MNKTDPIFERIAEYKAAAEAVNAACDKGTDIPDTMANAYSNALKKLSTMPPRTPEGVRALGTVIVSEWRMHFQDEMVNPCIRSFFVSLSNAMQPTPQTGTKPDPTYAAIRAHWEVWLTYYNACQVIHDTDEKVADADRLCTAYWKQTDKLAKVEPKTIAGLNAMFDYLLTVEGELDLKGFDPHEYVRFFRRLGVASIGLAHMRSDNPAHDDPAPPEHFEFMCAVRMHVSTRDERKAKWKADYDARRARETQA